MATIAQAEAAAAELAREQELRASEQRAREQRAQRRAQVVGKGAAGIQWVVVVVAVGACASGSVWVHFLFLRVSLARVVLDCT